jgi:RHS repeat-associated protein
MTNHSFSLSNTSAITPQSHHFSHSKQQYSLRWTSLKKWLIALFLLGSIAAEASASIGVDCTGLYPWNANSFYPANTRVHHQAVRYQANWWTQGHNPLTRSGQWQEWTPQGACIHVPSGSNCSALPEWDIAAVYMGGNDVRYQGKHYRANWYAHGRSPAQASGPWDEWAFLDKCADTSDVGQAPNGTLWVVTSSGISKRVNGQVKLLIPVESSALAIEPGNARLWSYHQGSITAFNQDGVIEVQEDLSFDFEAQFSVQLLADADGLWLAGGNNLSRLNPQGQLLVSLERSGQIRALAKDKRGNLWLAEGNDLRVIDGQGEDVAQVSVPSSARHLSYDRETDQIWVATESKLLAIDAVTHTQKLSFSLASPNQLTTSRAGKLWAVAADSLYYINGSTLGQAIPLLAPIQDLAADHENDGIWVAGLEKLAFYNLAGQKQFNGQVEGLIQHIVSDDEGLVASPELTILTPVSGQYSNGHNLLMHLEYHSAGVIDTESITIRNGETPLPLDCQADQTTATCTLLSVLPEGNITLNASISDAQGQAAESVSVTFIVDSVNPLIDISQPADGFHTNQPLFMVAGAVSEPLQSLSLGLGDILVTTNLNTDLTFSRQMSLLEGSNALVVTAIDRAGNTSVQSINIVLDTAPPSTPETTKITIGAPNNGEVTISGQSGAVEAFSRVMISNQRTGNSVVVVADGQGRFSILIGAVESDTLHITAKDIAGNTSAGAVVSVNSIILPPNPETVAPPITTSGTIPFSEGISFLYSGNNPIQTGVAPNTIDSERVAVIRGQVLNKQNQPLPGVRISIKGHPNLGQTYSRIDGHFDMAVNGGGNLTLDYEKDGYLPVQRKINTTWRDYSFAEEIVMIPLDMQVTSIDLSSPVLQVARGTVQTDSEGNRQATLLFPAGTTATMTLPDGSSQPLSSLSVRATEYTVGENGPQSMPGELPPNSAYTYAVELSVDEALSANASTVTFNQPVPLYVDNFLDFPVGEAVPAGYYDREKAAWIASDSGRIIAILSIESGLAQLDVTGAGVAATEEQMVELGITDAERAQLANLYSPGVSLWRTPIPHFTPWDCNWPYGPPEDAMPPPAEKPETPEDDRPDDSDDENKCDGCVISPQGQTLGEEIPITGTPFSMVYNSDRSQAYNSQNSVLIPISGPVVPGRLEKIELSVSVAGQHFQRTYSPAPGLRYSFVWDGLDGYGRKVTGSRNATINITYFYPCVYRSGGNGFAQFSSSLTPIGTRTNCQSMTFPRQWNVTLRSSHLDNTFGHLGNWTLSNHHFYDAQNSILKQGDGSSKKLQGGVITPIAGTGVPGFDGDGGLAVEAKMQTTDSVLSPDGNLYIVDSNAHRIRRVGRDGVITTVAGSGGTGSVGGGFSGDGGLAVNATLRNPSAVEAGPDGTLYIYDKGNHRIRMVRPDGVIQTIAGDGQAESGGDGGSALEAQILGGDGLALAPDGSVYFTDQNRVRKITPDGKINTIAGQGGRIIPGGQVYGFSGDGGLATQASLHYLGDIDLDLAGNLYIADLWNHRVRRVSNDGIITTIVGGGYSSFDPKEGVLASQVGLSHPQDVAVRPDGVVFIGESDRVSRVGTAGIYETVARISSQKISVGPDQNLYVTEYSQIRQIQADGIGRYTPDGFAVIASKDGGQLFVFDNYGKHLRTHNALTGEIEYLFEYDGEGLLVSVTDIYGGVTTIQRDSNGVATAIVAPDAQRTELTVDVNGHLTQVTNPAGESFGMTYSSGGLLTQFSDRKNQINYFDYNQMGRLTRDVNAGGGGWALQRTELENGYLTTMTTAEGRQSTFAVQSSPTSGRVQRNTFPNNTVQEKRFTLQGEQITLQPDGTTITVLEKPDPRFGMQSPIFDLSVKTPNRLSSVTKVTRTATLADPSDPLSLQTLIDTSVVNGRTFSSTYTASTGTQAFRTPEGRTSTQIIDLQGRPVSAQITGLAPMIYTYNSRGKLETVSIESDGEKRSTQFSYYNDGPQAGLLQQVTDAASRTVSFAYDPVGRLTKQTLPDNKEILYSYDANGNVTSIAPLGRSAHVFNYNAFDLADEYTPPVLDGITAPETRYNYNQDKDLIEVIRPDGQTLDLNYNVKGQLDNLTIPTGSYSYSYHPTSGQISDITAPDNGRLSFIYDGFLLTRQSWIGAIAGVVTYNYDNNFRLTSQSVNGTSAITFLYDKDSLLTGVGNLSIQRDAQKAGLITGTTQANIVTSYSYNGFGEPIAFTANRQGVALFNVSYQRDKLGRITHKTESSNGTTLIDGYTYDLAGRLTTVNRNGQIITYTYDTNGNRLGKTSGANMEIGAYDNQDRLLSYANCSYSYTTNGELQTKTCGSETTAYNYDVLGNLLSVVLANGVQIEYVIDGQNRRVGKKVNGNLVQGLLYQGKLNPVAELNANGSIRSRFVYGDKFNVPAYMIRDGVTYRIISDHLGSPRLVINTVDGTVAQRLDFDEFGNITSDTNPGFQPFGFAGGIYDQHTKLTRFGARDYDSYTGRWTAKDPIMFEGGDSNLFGYVGNDPINFVDPTGLNGIPLPTNVPGGPWEVHPNAERAGQWLGEKVASGGRKLCQYVPPEGQGGPPGSKGYFKVQTPGEKGWQRFSLEGKPGSASDFHRTVAPRLILPIFLIPKVILDYGTMSPGYEAPDA